MIQNPMLAMLAALAVGYLVGGVDFAVLVARSKGVDIYEVGSGNPGTSNVLRTLGKGPAAFVLIGDLMKGLVASGIGFFLADADAIGAASPAAVAALGGFAAVLGHCYPALHRFKGGKGVATGFGVILFAQPLAGVVLGLIWAVVVGITRTASLGSLLVVVLTLPSLALLGSPLWQLVWVAAALSLIVYRHKGNIERLLRRAEETVTQ